MESMNLLDVTIKYFNVIVFVMCVVFGMISFFASWIAWREIQHKRNIMRSVLAAYNITEDTVENGRTPSGDLDLDPEIVQTVFNSLQEILNAIYGDVTGKQIPSREERMQDREGKSGGLRGIRSVLGRKEKPQVIDADIDVPALMPDELKHHEEVSHP